MASRVQPHSNVKQQQEENHSREDNGIGDSVLFEPLLDCVEAAKLLRMHPETVRAKARSGEIPAIQIGRTWRFRASILNRWIEQIAS